MTQVHESILNDICLNLIKNDKNEFKNVQKFVLSGKPQFFVFFKIIQTIEKIVENEFNFVAHFVGFEYFFFIKII